MYTLEDERMTLRHSKDIPRQVVKAGNHTTIQVLLQGPNFAMRRFTMEPGGGMPDHTNTVEHEQYRAARSRRAFAVGIEEFDVQAGDVVLIPAGVPHWYRNSGRGKFRVPVHHPQQRGCGPGHRQGLLKLTESHMVPGKPVPVKEFASMIYTLGTNQQFRVFVEDRTGYSEF